MHSLPTVLYFVAIFLLIPVSNSEAQRRPRESQQQQDKADGQSPEYRALVQDALREFDVGNWNEALALFQRAHALEPNARTLRGIGFCLFENRRYVEALQHLQQAMVDTRNPLTPEQRSSTQQVLERAAAFVGHTTIQLRPADAHLLIDGKETSLNGSGVMLLDPGEHELSASADGFEPHTLKVLVKSGTNEPFKLELSPEPRPSAEIVQAPPRETAPAPSPDERARLKRALMISGFSLAGVALVNGAVTGLLALLSENKLEDRCPDHVCPADQESELAKAKALALVSSISFGVAALGAGLGLTGALLPSSDKRAAKVTRLQLRAGPLSLSVRGTF